MSMFNNFGVVIIVEGNDDMTWIERDAGLEQIQLSKTCTTLTHYNKAYRFFLGLGISKTCSTSSVQIIKFER